MSSAGSTMDPHDKMRARDISKVARGEQAPPPRPPRQSPPPPNISLSPSASLVNDRFKLEEESSNNKSKKEKMRRCYETYYDYHRCIEEKGAEAEACKKVADYYKSTCPEWIEGWKIK